MAEWKFDPFARTTVLGAHKTTDTSIRVPLPQGLRFPNVPAQLAIWDATLWENPLDAFYGENSPVEIVHQLVAGTQVSLPSVTRAQEGTIALDMTDTTKTFAIQAVQTSFVVAREINAGKLVITTSNGVELEGDALLTIGDGAWDGEHVKMGTHHIWVDSTGDLRIKDGAPSSDTDGVVVGSQS